MVHMPAMNTIRFSLVKSHLPHHPQPVPPIYQTEVGARAVRHAAERAHRAMWVGLPTVGTVLGKRKIAPLLDRYLGRTGYGAKQSPQDDRPEVGSCTCDGHAPRSRTGRRRRLDAPAAGRRRRRPPRPGPGDQPARVPRRGAFTLCGFIAALDAYRDGQPVTAERRFERNRASCGPTGLFTEEEDIAQRQLRGNPPQAFVHALMLETAAVLADRP